jgi:hypothetical protein
MCYLHEINVRVVTVHAMSSYKRIAEKPKPLIIRKRTTQFIRHVPPALPFGTHALATVFHLIQGLVHMRMHEEAVGALEVATFDQHRIAYGVWCMWTNSIPERRIREHVCTESTQIPILYRAAALEFFDAFLGNSECVVWMCTP